MKVIDVHPEELLDRELRGGLTDGQRALLDAHLVHCESCRLERLLRADFSAEAQSAAELDTQSFVLGALQRAASVEAADSTPALAVGAGTGRRLSAMLLVACIVLVATGAAAARTTWVERIFQVTLGTAELVSSGVRAPKHAGKSRPRERALSERHGARLAAPREVELSQAAGVQAGAIARPRDTLPVATPEVARVKLPAAPLALHKHVKPRAAQVAPRESQQRSAFATLPSPMAPAAEAPQSVVREAVAKPSASAADDTLKAALSPASLFEQANRARRNGRLDQAAALYGSLQTTFARSAEAKLSYALTARMWLDSGNAYAAYGGFEQYLASGDRALREEAMAGRALSLERLGRMRAAESAFAELLRAYPHSSYAQLARKRLGQD